MDRTATNDEKVRLFRSLFAGRADVFARRYENATKGTSGYSPFCRNQWSSGCALRRHGTCADCPVRQFVPVSDEAVRAHLRGKDANLRPFVMGVYPMSADETVRLAVIDFDESAWRRDALFVVRKARELALPPALEISRSGKGAHLWFFFQSPVPARIARAALTYVLTCVLEEHPEVGLDSYDRIIPCQDTLPRGGFGSLVALPLQAEARKGDRSVFVNDDWVPYADQWAFLSSVTRIGRVALEALLRKERAGRQLFLSAAHAAADGARPWEFFLPLWSVGESRESPTARMPMVDVNVVLANRVYVEQERLTPAVRCRLIGLASFSNPEFYSRQRLKYSVYGQPRVISRALNGERFLQMPRGCLESVLKALKAGRFNPVLTDRRYAGVPLDATFRGELRPGQKLAVSELRKSDTGILAAGTAFGKTVVAASLIAERKVNTLVLVNRRQLQMQWVAQLSSFLGIPERDIGRIGAGTGRWTGKIDVAILQSVSRKGVVDPRVKEYGQIVIDECHAVAAETFEAAVDAAPARYVLGLSATVDRKDGQHPLIMMQCGPIRHRVDPKTLAMSEPFDHVVHVRPTSFHMPVGGVGDDGRLAFGVLCAALVADAARNRQIVEDVLSAVSEGRSPVVLSDRREHVEALARLLEGRVRHVVVLMGGMGARQMRAARERLAGLSDAESRVILATGSFLGEGFDDARLDTLFLALPVSWKGRLTQFAGRLHRLRDGKREVRIYDYVDLNVDVCSRMYDRRAKAYAAIGYRLVVPVGMKDGWPASVALPAVPHWQETFSDSVRRLCRDGLDEALADLFVRATLLVNLGPRGVGHADAAQAARAFLFARLESYVATKGLFRENVRVPIPCGANSFLEVDLLAEKARLAIRLDAMADVAGVEAYRRARREDALLQRKGYRIVRFLAEDICTRLDATLDALLAWMSNSAPRE